MNVNHPSFSGCANSTLNEERELNGNDDTINDPNFVSDHCSVCETFKCDEKFVVPIKKYLIKLVT